MREGPWRRSQARARLAGAVARTRARSTAALARRRVPLGFAGGALVLWLAQPTPRLLAVGALVACAGEALRIWAAGHLNKSRTITSSGPYQHLAHPLYVGSAMMGTGLAIASRSTSAALLIAVYLGATLTAAMRREEAFLRETFGPDYERYRREGAVDRQARFSGKQALANHEHRAALGLVAAMLLLLWKATYN